MIFLAGLDVKASTKPVAMTITSPEKIA